MSQALNDIVESALQQRARLNRFFLQNASVNRNLPYQEDSPIQVRIVHENDEPPKPAQPTPAPTPVPTIIVNPAPVTIMPSPVPTEKKEESTSTVVVTPSNPPASPSQQLAAAVPTWMKVALGALLLMAGAGSAAAIANYFKKPDAPVVAPSQQQDGSVLQYLEDGGWHVQ